MQKLKVNNKELSWLSFNQRVLQEAKDETVSLRDRIKFLGIFSNNLDEFFRVRFAGVKKAINKKNSVATEIVNKKTLLNQIHERVVELQDEFDIAWQSIVKELKLIGITFIQANKLTKTQKQFVHNYFNQHVRNNVVPLLPQSFKKFPQLSDKSIYLACVLKKKDKSIPNRYGLISVSTRFVSRFLILPNTNGKLQIILLEEIIKQNLPEIFSFFGYDGFTAHLIKISRDAEIELDGNDFVGLQEAVKIGLRNRKKALPVRFVYDKDIDINLLNYLKRNLKINSTDSLLPGGSIHNFKDFMRFPFEVLPNQIKHPIAGVTHHLLKGQKSIQEVVQKQDVLLCTPYHNYNSIIDLLREAAIDPTVVSIKVTCYRLANKSKIINALTNAVRNGKKVTAILEIRARFDEEANLNWQEALEEAGVKVVLGDKAFKVHAKLCLITKKVNKTLRHLGFISTGNLNENTADIYTDFCLLTNRKKITSDILKIFKALEHKQTYLLKKCTTIWVSPLQMRKNIFNEIDAQISLAKKGKPAQLLFKVNALTDIATIEKIHDAAVAGVVIRIIVRGMCCFRPENETYKNVQVISILDNYLEHARVYTFGVGKKQKIYISSADLMTRNLDLRIEAAAPILADLAKKQILQLLELQLADNVKARKIDNAQNNLYCNSNTPKIRSQYATQKFINRLN
jgi:polyphosphate kinase